MKDAILQKLYTARWYLTEAINKMKTDAPAGAASDLLACVHEIDSTKSMFVEAPEPAEEPERPSLDERGKNSMFYPLAIQKYKHAAPRKFRKGHPEGLIVHFTAGHCETDKNIEGSIEYGKSMGYSYWGIGVSGQVYQTHPLSDCGSHAGTSFWPSLGKSVSQYCLGVEISNAGKVDANGKSWFGKVYPPERLRKGPKKENCEAGTYVKYTEAQEESLIQLCLWLKRNNPEVFSFDLVLGHDSVAPGRKNDPGWSLSMTIPELQAKLKALYAAELEHGG